MVKELTTLHVIKFSVFKIEYVKEINITELIQGYFKQELQVDNN